MCYEKKNKCSEKENTQDPEVMHEGYETDISPDSLFGDSQRDNQECCRQFADIQEKYAHITADFNNFRLRIEKEKMQWSINAQLDIIKKLLPTIDMFDRAFQESAKSGIKTDIDNQLLMGFSMIHKNFLKTLASIGVETMHDYTVFDPQKHEAIMQVDSPEHKSDDIVEVLEKGYTFKDAVVRPAKVSVAR